jgi:enediyne biosynthesis protein E4
LKFFDYDNDGDPDLLLVNGHPDDLIEMRLKHVKYKEPLLMFENTGHGFKNVSASSGAVFTREFSGRGMAVGDFDNDGFLDVLISNNGEAPILLHNKGGNRNNWLGVQLVGARSNPAGVGAVITWQAGGVKRTRLKTAGGSYLASHDPRDVLGVGSASTIDSVEIRWPGGKVDKLTNPPLNTYIRVVEGEGIAKGKSTTPKQ